MMTTKNTPNSALNTDSPTGFSPKELARRRTASRRLAWMLGAAALAIYLVGMLFKR